VLVGTGVIGVAAERRRVVCVPSLTRSRAMRAGIAESVRRSGGELAAKEIPLPGLADVESVAAVPLIAHGELVGVLYLESERHGAFGPAAERLLRIVGGHLAAGLALSQADRREAEGPTGVSLPTPGGDAVVVVYYQADDSVFVDDEYLIKGVPGRICGSCCGRTWLTGARLSPIVSCGWTRPSACRSGTTISRRGFWCCGSGSTPPAAASLERVGRGRLALRLERPVRLQDVPTVGRCAGRTRRSPSKQLLRSPS
jgi:GAF domain